MIVARGLGKSYRTDEVSELTVLSGISFEIPSGEFVALTGPSGSGKSTLLSLLAGLDSPSEGSIEVAGRELGRMSEDELARFRGENLGFIFQSYYLVPNLSALENIALPLALQRKPEATSRAKEWLEKVGLASRANHLPRQLSGGEQQRVAVARALVAGPRVVFADEPTGNLDSENGRKVIELLESKRGDATLVLVTHDASLAERAGRRIRLQDGKLV